MLRIAAALLAAVLASHALADRPRGPRRARGARRRRDEEKALRTALLERMTETELDEVLAFQNDPRAGELLRRMQELGIDVAAMFRVVAMAARPHLYSRAEHDETKRKLSSIEGRKAELNALTAEMQAQLKALKQPALVKFQAIVRENLQLGMQRLAANPAFLGAVKELVHSWKQLPR